MIIPTTAAKAALTAAAATSIHQSAFSSSLAILLVVRSRPTTATTRTSGRVSAQSEHVASSSIGRPRQLSFKLMPKHLQEDCLRVRLPTSLHSSVATTTASAQKHKHHDASGTPIASRASVNHLVSFMIRCVTTLIALGINILDEHRCFIHHPRIQRLVSRFLFWPTMPWIMWQRRGQWATRVDGTVILGGAPIKIPLFRQDYHQVDAIINMCEEYTYDYCKLDSQHRDIKVLHLPTINHMEPSLEDLKLAIHFIAKCQSEGKRVYVHCRAGNGRSAAVVLAWLLISQRQRQRQPQYKKDLPSSLQQLNQLLGQKRRVRNTLWQQPNLQIFEQWWETQQVQGGPPPSRRIVPWCS